MGTPCDLKWRTSRPAPGISLVSCHLRSIFIHSDTKHEAEASCINFATSVFDMHPLWHKNALGASSLTMVSAVSWVGKPRALMQLAEKKGKDSVCKPISSQLMSIQPA